VLVPGNFVRVRVGAADEHDSLLVPDAALGTDQGGRYLLVLDKNNVVEQRKVAIGPKVGDLRVVESGLKADDRVVVAGILRAIPGQKVDPQLETVAATPATTGAANSTGHDLRFFHPPARSGERARLLEGRDRRRRLVCAARGPVIPIWSRRQCKSPRAIRGQAPAPWSIPWRCRSSSR